MLVHFIQFSVFLPLRSFFVSARACTVWFIAVRMRSQLSQLGEHNADRRRWQSLFYGAISGARFRSV